MKNLLVLVTTHVFFLRLHHYCCTFATSNAEYLDSGKSGQQLQHRITGSIKRLEVSRSIECLDKHITFFPHNTLHTWNCCVQPFFVWYVCTYSMKASTNHYAVTAVSHSFYWVGFSGSVHFLPFQMNPHCLERTKPQLLRPSWHSLRGVPSVLFAWFIKTNKTRSTAPL